MHSRYCSHLIFQLSLLQSIKHLPSAGAAGHLSVGGRVCEEEWQSTFYPAFHGCVIIGCCLATMSWGTQAEVIFGCRQQPGRVIILAIKPLFSTVLLWPCHLAQHLPLPGKSWSLHLAHFYKQLLDMSFLDQMIPWRLGGLGGPLMSKWATSPSSFLYQCRMVWEASALLPFLNCNRKIVHPSTFLTYLHSPWVLLLLLSCFSTWY